MKPGEAKTLIDNCLKRGWIWRDNKIYTPTEAAALKIDSAKPKRAKKAIRTADTNDELNIRNKARHTDQFTRLIEIELGVEVWPEYSFTTERRYRLDYAIAEYKIGIECDGGTWARGNSGHSSGKGIQRDMAKASLLAANGWLLIRRTPQDLITNETIDLIKQAINQKI